MFNNPKVRLGFYGLSTLVAWLLPLLVGFGAITAAQGGNITSLIAAIGGLTGLGTAVAGGKLAGQIKDGSVGPKDAVTQAVSSISNVSDEFNNLIQNVISGTVKVQEVVGGLSQYIPPVATNPVAVPNNPLTDEFLK